MWLSADGEYVAGIVKKAGARVLKGFRHLYDGGGGVQGGDRHRSLLTY